MKGILRDVLLLAAAVRIGVTLMAMASTLSGSTFDTSAFIRPQQPAIQSRMERAIVSLGNWDGMYFRNISNDPYAYEQVYAFFPLLPAVVAGLRSVAAPLLGVEVPSPALDSALGSLFCNTCFVASAAVFYTLSVMVLTNKRWAWMATVLYIFNPASIFASAVYTESPFALFSLLGIVCTMKALQSKHVVANPWWPGAVMAFHLATWTRSNGFLLSGFLLFSFAEWSRRTAEKGSKESLVGLLLSRAALALSCLLVVSPLLLHQLHGYYQFCKPAPPLLRNFLSAIGVRYVRAVDSLSRSVSGPLVDCLRPYCVDALMPQLYSYIQGRYWGVGFLKYFTMKQIPNFILSAPALFLTLASGIYAIAAHPFLLHHLVQLSLALLGCGRAPSNHNGLEGFRGTKTLDTVATATPRYIPAQAKTLLPFAVYQAGLALICLLFMHVQVLTRFLCSSPLQFWFAAGLYTEAPRLGRAIVLYFLVYIALGATLFANFYPWT